MNVHKLKLHPAAEIFPMLPDDELDELAADIKANGLLQPLIVQDDLLIDGRNRREACKRAGVEPRIEELNGTDPIAYILGANINRRHLSKGQRAMAIAMLYPEPEKGGRGKINPLKNSELSRQYVGFARTVLRETPQIAAAVMAGTIPLNKAYEDAQQLRGQMDEEPKRLEKLRAKAPDLADLVAEERMTILEAESACETRQEQWRQQRQAALGVIDGLDRLLDTFADTKRRKHFSDHIDGADRPRAKTLCKQWMKHLTLMLEELS